MRIANPTNVFKFCLLFFGLGIASPAVRLEAQTFQENALIANYLVGFSEFTECDKTDNVITIAVSGADGVIEELKALPQEVLPPDRTLEIINWNVNDPLEDVDILFLSKSRNRSRFDSIIAQAKLHSVLTVSDANGFIEQDGLIQFVTRKNRLRFMLANEKSAEYGIYFSSKLVNIALPGPASSDESRK